MDGLLDQAGKTPANRLDSAATRLKAGRRRITTRKGLLSFHLAAVSLQIGLMTGLLGLQFIAGVNGEVTRRAVLYDAIASLEYFGLYPLVGLTILSGVILGIYNHSGFLTAWWLIVKQAAFVAVAVVVTLVIGPGSPEIAELANHSGKLTPEIANFQTSIILGLVFYLLVALFMVVISVFKPWGRRK